MLAGMRSCFLFCFLLAFSVAAGLPLQAQVNGVPPSVTSIGFGGNSVNGVRPSVTSLGPKGYGNSWPVFGNCCAFWPVNPNPPLSSGRHHRKGKDKDKDRGRADSLVGVSEPVYIPYAVPYAPESDDDSPDADYVHAPGPPNHDASIHRSGEGDSNL